MNIGTTADETDNALAQLRTILAARMLVLRPEDQIASEIALPPLVIIDDRSGLGPGSFDSPTLDRVLGAAKIYCEATRPEDLPGIVRVRAVALDLAAGISPTVEEERNCIENLRHAGPAVLLITPCVETDDWIHRWEASFILMTANYLRDIILRQK